MWPTPIVHAKPDEGFCVNYSSALLPAVDGTSVLEAATDLDNGVCHAYLATGPLPRR